MVQVASPEDLSAIAALNVEAFSQYAAHMTVDGWQSMRGNLHNVAARAQSATFLVIRDAGVIVGSVGYYPAGKADPAIFPPDWAAIALLVVHPMFQRRGVGRELARACIGYAREQRASAIGLFTSELMRSAQQLYDSLGFRRESEISPRHGLRYFRYKLELSKGAE